MRESISSGPISNVLWMAARIVRRSSSSTWPSARATSKKRATVARRSARSRSSSDSAASFSNRRRSDSITSPGYAARGEARHDARPPPRIARALARFLLLLPTGPRLRGRPVRKEPKRMKKPLAVLVFLLAAIAIAVPPTQAFQTTYARTYDVQRLQDDLAVLEDTLGTVPTTHPRYREFQRRADELRTDLTQ